MTETKKSKKTKKTPSPSKIKKLESKLMEQEEEINQWKTTAQRSQADLINLKRRTLEEMQVNKRKTKINLFTKFLNTLDELHMTKDSLPTDKAFKGWLEGIEIIISKFETSLTQEGLVKLHPEEGDDFNPQIHESLSIQETKTKKLDGKISQTVKTGYSIEETIIRPAQVILLKHIT
jgi:molecular chaperone GrpE